VDRRVVRLPACDVRAGAGSAERGHPRRLEECAFEEGPGAFERLLGGDVAVAKVMLVP